MAKKNLLEARTAPQHFLDTGTATKRLPETGTAGKISTEINDYLMKQCVTPSGERNYPGHRNGHNVFRGS